MHPLRWLRPGSHTISPTALYTGQVWQAHALGVAVVTEGLLHYFPTPDVRRLWSRIATATRDLPRGLDHSDLHLDEHVAAPDRVFEAWT